jgi:hypothetical protein
MFEQDVDINIKYVIEKINSNNIDDIFKNICYIKDNYVIVDYVYIKHFANNETYELILQYILNNIDNVLKHYNLFGVHVNTKMLTLNDIDKHSNFIKHMCSIFKTKYPNKLDFCYVYNAPHIFSHLYSIISLFLDKITKAKIIIVKK